MLEESLSYRLFIKIKAYIKGSYTYRVFKKESFVPDIYRGSITMASVVIPAYERIKACIRFPQIISQGGLAFAIFVFSFYNPIVCYTPFAKIRLGLLFFPFLFVFCILGIEAKVPQTTPFDLPLFSLGLIAILSLHTVEDPAALLFGLREFLSFSLFAISIYLAIYTFTKKNIKRLFYILSLGGAGASSLFIINKILLDGGSGYLSETFGNPNHFGYFLILIYPIAFAISLDRSERLKYLWRLSVVSILAGIFFSRSLGAWVLFFLSIPVLSVSLKKMRPLILLLGVILVFVFSPELREIVGEEISLGYGSTILARVEVWKEAMRAIYNRPFLGIGLGQFAASAKPYYAKQMYNAFSVFLHLCATTGTFGLMCLLWFLVRAFKLNLSLLISNRLYGGALFTSLAAGVVGFFWDTHLLAIMTNWLLGLLGGSSFVMAQKGD